MRAVQGLGAAIMLPAALSIVMNMFAEGGERNKALGIWGGLGAGGGTVGLIAGGLITRYIGWEYIFYINVPIGVGRAGAGSAARSGQPGGGAASAVRPARGDHRHGRARAAGGGDLRGAALRLGRYADSRDPGGIGRDARGVPGRRDTDRGSTAPDLDLPAAHVGRRERRRAAARRKFLRVHVRRHALHAAGAALQRAADRAGVAGRVGDLDGAGRPSRRCSSLGSGRRSSWRSG